MKAVKAVEDEKGVRDQVDDAKANAQQAARLDWKPALDHPWHPSVQALCCERAAVDAMGMAA